MDIIAIKNEIAKRTGLSPDLLQGETPQDLINYAKGLLEFKESQRSPISRLASQLGGPSESQTALAALDDLSVTLQGYPEIQDAGIEHVVSNAPADPVSEAWKQVLENIG